MENPEEDMAVEQKIKRWLTKSGRDIELQVANAARDAGATAFQSVPYVDAEEHKERETDVVAQFDGQHGTDIPVFLVIECKRAHGKHWVTFPHEGWTISPQPIENHALVDPGDYVRTAILEEDWSGGESIFAPEPALSTGLVEADLSPTSSKRGDSNSLDTGTNALRQCWSAARGLLIPYGTGAFGELFPIIIPVIVTWAQLWTCRLATDGSGVQVDQADYARIRAPGMGHEVLIHVMGPGRFATFARQVSKLQARRQSS